MRWFWRFILYSFAGFLLEVVFARLTSTPKRDRKCLLLLPLCPVYGLGALLILWTANPAWGYLGVAIAGGAAATLAELCMGLLYRHAAKVEFWNYRDLPGNLAGLVCPWFAMAWGVLAVLLVYRVQPVMETAVASIPDWLFPPALILLLSDLLVTSVALRRAGTTEVLRWYASEPREAVEAENAAKEPAQRA